MNKHFVPYEIALKLRELGFNEKCFKYWNITNFIKEPTLYGNNLNGYSNLTTRKVPAPLWQQAFDWARDTHGLIINIQPDSINLPEKQLKQYVITAIDKNRVLEKYVQPGHWIRNGCIKTYEEAKILAMFKVFEILEQESLEDKE